MLRLLRTSGEWDTKLKKINKRSTRKKHILQWKFAIIMFISIFCGVIAMAICQAYLYGYLGDMTAEEAEKSAQNATVWFDLLFIIVSAFVFFLLSRKIIKRIENMNHNVEQIAAGQMEELIIDKKKDELGNLAQNINGMAKTIHNSLEKERGMVCNVAHDLRTPVTSIQGYAQLLEESEELSEKNKEYVTIIKNKTIDLSEQINELLEYSLLQFQEKEYEFTNLSLSSLVEQVLIEFIPQLEKEDIEYSLQGNQKEHRVNCNTILMVRLLENLLTNSIRYGKQGGQIEIVLEDKNSVVRTTISNYGNCLNEEDKAHIFEAFYQGESGKDYSKQSKGLGLAIANQIIQVHNGTIWVDSNQATGKTSFIFELSKIEN